MEKLLNEMNDNLDGINIDLTMMEAYAILGCIGQSTPINEEDEKICRGVFEKIDKAVCKKIDKVMDSAFKIYNHMSNIDLDEEKLNDSIDKEW